MSSTNDKRQEKRCRSDKKCTSNENLFNTALISILIVIIVFVGICNVQVFLLTDRLNTTISAFTRQPEAKDEVIGVDTAANMPHSNAVMQLGNISKIDEFLKPSLWLGAPNISKEPGSLRVSGNEKLVEMYRKYDGFLDLQTYIDLDACVDAIENIDWITLYLMEDMSYANYFECDLKPFLSDSVGKILLNKKDFVVGTGIPKWDNISTVRIAFETYPGKQATLTLGEISTYAASPMCSIWFDDGWKTTYTQAYPIMKQKDFRGILSVVSSHVGYEAFCSEAELREMYDNGWDLTNHTYSHKNLTEIDEEEARFEIMTCFDYLNEKGFMRASDHFVPPYCATNEAINSIIGDYAQSSRPTWESYNYLPIAEPMDLCFKEVMPDMAPETVYEWIDEAIENDLWLVLLFHSIETPADSSIKCSIENFAKIIDYLDKQRSQIDVVTMSSVQDTVFNQNIDEQTQTAQNTKSKKGYQLVWEDNFNEKTLDKNSWNALETPPFKNNELQTYRQENIKVEDGFLKIISENKDGYFSGALTTNNKQLFRYGKIEIKAKLPGGKAIFPAFWMLPQSGKNFPEVDIIEFLGNKPNEVWHVFHYENEGGKQRAYQTVETEPLTEDFHIYALEWTPDRLTWLIDGEETFAVQTNIPTEKMYLYINTAIGGDWPGNPSTKTEFPRELVIDYVKYYSKD